VPFAERLREDSMSRDESSEIDRAPSTLRYNSIGLLYHHLQQNQDARFYDHSLDLGKLR